MHHKNPDCGNVEIGEGNCPCCWRDTLTCDDKSHHFSENNNMCDCRKLTRAMAENETFTGGIKEKVKEHFKVILELIEDPTYPARRNISDYVELIIGNFHFEWRDEFEKMANEFYQKNDAKLRR
jgi:hypothetical protein